MHSKPLNNEFYKLCYVPFVDTIYMWICKSKKFCDHNYCIKKISTTLDVIKSILHLKLQKFIIIKFILKHEFNHRSDVQCISAVCVFFLHLLFFNNKIFSFSVHNIWANSKYY